MNSQVERAILFKKFHVKGDPLILYNIWDAGSAKSVQDVGVKAIATSSWSVANAHGYEDGEKLPFELALSNLKRIIDIAHLPVTIDIEGGYGKTPSEVQKTVIKVIEAGAVGINFEDQILEGEGLYDIEYQCARIKAIREVAKQAEIPIFINARTDIFLKSDRHNEKHLEEAQCRALAYAKAGADGFFTPGLINTSYILRLVECSPIPINIMILPDHPHQKKLSTLGVARISYGPEPYCKVIDALKAMQSS